MKEFHTTVRAEVYITLRSGRALDREEVHTILSEMHYEFGDEQGYGLDDGESAYITATRWEENEITHLNEELEDA